MEPRREALQREVRLGYRQGKRSYVSVVREHYLREDISCLSELCVLCPELNSSKHRKKGEISQTVRIYYSIFMFGFIRSPLRGPKKIIPHS